MAIDWNVINWIEGRKSHLTVIKLKLLYKDPEFAAFYSSWKYQNKIRPDNTTKKRFSASKYGVPTKRTDWVHSAILLKNTTYQYNCTLVTSRCRDNLRAKWCCCVLTLPVQLGHDNVLGLSSASSGRKVDVDWKKSERKEKERRFQLNSK